MYSPDLAPMDFRVFPELKRQLKGFVFYSVTEQKLKRQRIVSSFDQTWYTDTFNKWVSRHRKCILVNGEYLEKE